LHFRSLILLAALATASSSWARNVDLEKIYESESLRGAPLDLLRLDDALRSPNAFAQGGDLMEQFVRFIFPITGRERRTIFMAEPYWGVKKPQYRKFDWQEFETEHFKIYTYTNGTKLLPDLASFLEGEHERNNRVFGVENRFTKKTPVIFYQTRRDFEQSTVIEGPIPEGLGGVTEIFSWKRATFPFEGERELFEHVAKHEGTHIYQIAKNARRLPLWFIEGSAETNSIRWDVQAELTIRDAYLNGFFFHIPDLWQIQGTFLMYKIGNFICNVIWDEYGEEGFRKIFDRSSKMEFEDNLKESLGLTLEELDRKVFADLEKKFGPTLAQKDLLGESSKRLEKDKVVLHSFGRFYLSGGATGPREALYVNHVGPEGKVSRAKVIEDRRFRSESLNHFRKGAYINEHLIAYAIRRSKKDVIRVVPYQFHLKEREFELGNPEEFSWDHLEILSNPILIGEHRIGFIGYEGGFSNVYIFDRTNSQLEKLTNNNRHYEDLDYNSKTNELAFSREDDRLPDRLRYDRNIYLLNLETKAIRPLTQTPRVKEWQPRFSPDGTQVLFGSDENGTLDLRLIELSSGRTRALSRAKVGYFNPSWFSDDSIIFNTLEKLDPNIHVAQIPSLHDQIEATMPVSNYIPMELSNGTLKPTLEKPLKKFGPVSEENVTEVREGKLTIVRNGIPYRIDAAAHMPDELLLYGKSIRDGRDHFFVQRGLEAVKLESKQFAQHGLANSMAEHVEKLSGGRKFIDGWMDIEKGLGLVVLNNRLATKEEKLEDESDVSLALFRNDSQSLQFIEKAPVSDVRDRIQWVVFLDGGSIFLALGDEPTGPFRLFVVPRDLTKARELTERAEQFRVSSDRKRVAWRIERSVYRAEVDTLATVEVDLPFAWNSQRYAFDFNPDGSLEILASRGDEWFADFFDSAGKVITSEKIEHEPKVRLIAGAIDPVSRQVTAIVKDEGEESRGEQVRRYDPAKKKTETIADWSVHYRRPAFRNGYLTFVEQPRYPAPEKIWIVREQTQAELRSVLKTELKPGRWVLETNGELFDYDLSKRKSNSIAEATHGFAVLTNNDIVYSSPKEGEYELYSYSPESGAKKEYHASAGDDVDPVAWDSSVAWSHRNQGHWELMTTKPLPLKGYDLVHPERSDDQVIVRAHPSEFIPVEPSIVQTFRYPGALDGTPAHPRFRLRSLNAAAGYDGDSFRYFISAFADNLFSDKGIFVNSVFVGEARFATVGFSDLLSGRSYSGFYNSRNEVSNGGLHVDQRFTLDRYREVTLFGEFEIQDYGLIVSDTVDFISPNTVNQTFYVAKAGATYAHDVTVWDNHGPVSGSRFFIRAESGLDTVHGTLANIDANLDFRAYHQILPRFGFAHRLVAGTSQGDLPSVFLLGGNMSFRGIGFDDLNGQNYWTFSEDMRLPIFDFLGAKFFDPVDYILGLFTRYFDVRGGIYGDVGGAWFNNEKYDTIYSIGYFVNVPTIFGIQFRFNQGFAGKTGIGIWLGMNW
jgi:hypothetical protein